VGNVNDSGNNATSLPFSYQSGVTTVLSSLVGQESAGYATGVNNAGTIVGNLRTNNTSEAFALSSSGQLTLLGGTNVDASGINSAGTIVGSANFSGDSNGPVAASTWSVGGYALPPTNLGAGIGTLGQFINDSGDIAGTNPDGFQTNPFIEHDGQTMPLDVSPFNNGQFNVDSLNDSGAILGTGYNAIAESTLFYVYQNGVFTNVNYDTTSGVFPFSAGSLNDLGQILAPGEDNDDNYQALLFTPVSVPEPCGTGLLCISAIGLLRRRRRA
jgi:hypothetical protein